MEHKTAKFTVEWDLFHAGISTYSADLFEYEKVKPPVYWADKWWICASKQESYSHCSASMYQLVPAEQWDGDVYVYGCVDEEQILHRHKTGEAWFGMLVTIDGDDSGKQWVMGHRVRWTREARKPKTSNTFSKPQATF